MQGYIKLYRKLLENPIMKKPYMLQLWVYCLLKVNHEPGRTHFGKDDIDISPGQFVTGRFEIASALGEKPSTIYKRLIALSNTGFLNINSNNKNSLITIVNWDLYQAAENESNNKSNNKVTTKSQQSSTNKNDKNVRMEEVKIYSPLETAIDDFKEFRKKIRKPMTDKAVELLIMKLNKLAQDDETKIAILNESIVNSWQGVFPLKESEQKPPGKAEQKELEFQQKLERSTARLKAQGVKFDDDT